MEDFYGIHQEAFFKRHFIGTTFGQELKMATDLKTVVKSLQDQEVERGSPKWPPIPYIPVEGDIGEQVEQAMGGAKNFKIKLSDETGVLSHNCWDGGSNEAFLVHIISALSYCDHKHYFSKHEKAEKAHQVVVDETKLCRQILAVANPTSEDVVEISYKQENLNVALKKEADAQETTCSKVQEGFSRITRTFLAIQPKWSGTKLLPIK